MKPRVVAICGNGAGATLLLLRLARYVDRPVSIVVIGIGSRCGEGIAYSTTNPDHLLNVPASRMSADISMPLQFKHWLEKRGLLAEDFAAQFISRSIYAEYLDELLKASVQSAPNLDVRFVQAEVHNLIRGQLGWTVVHNNGSVSADVVVLATGNDMPAPLAPLYKDVAQHIIDIPWGPLPVKPEEDILILGTGLTAMDAVITLSGQGHRGAIYLLSRRGLCPARHVSPTNCEALQRPFPTTVRGLARAMRQKVGNKPAPEKWQAFMDSMRPFWPEIWRNFPKQERERFLRHGMTHWSIHRHRLAPAMADRFEAASHRNVKVLKGRLGSLSQAAQGILSATIIYRGKSQSLTVHRVINCTGLNSDPTKSYYPLVQNIIASRHAKSGPAKLGLEVDAKNRVINVGGETHTDLFAMGALTRGRWWEITAIPEISRQATEIADHLRAYLDASEATTCVSAGPID